jgi:hypothetical protein
MKKVFLLAFLLVGFASAQAQQVTVQAPAATNTPDPEPAGSGRHSLRDAVHAD